MSLPSRPPLRTARFARAGTAALFAAAVSVIGVAACSTDPRKSGEGESCQSTDDCADPLLCVALACVQPGMGTGGAPGTTASSTVVGSTTVASTTATKASSTTGIASSSTGTILDPELCEMCLDQKCATQLAACDDNCLHVEACIEAACKNLVENSLPDEGMCQVFCQNQYASGKQKHLNVVNCSQGGCDPCSSNPFDYDDCRVKADQGPCADERMACMTDTDCVAYSNCAATCQTLAACVACQSGTSGMAGYTLALAYETCVATECIAESWLP